MSLNTHVAQTAIDFKGLAELRRSATVDKDDQETLKQVAGQFESLFVTMMLKSMRQASLGKGIFDSDQSDMYRDMADQQLAMDISSTGSLGLRDVILRQLGGKVEPKSIKKAEQTVADPSLKWGSAVITNPALFQQAMQSAPRQTDAINKAEEIKFDSSSSFVKQLWSMAKTAADKIGVSPDVILAQAALETGWGQHVIKKANGQSSHNLFNIKADSRWQGDFTAKPTLEYRDGIAVKEQAKFRSYDSYQDSFNDYIQFLQTQPRYQNALKSVGNAEDFIDGLHKAGYATDPAYSNKIKQIMNGDLLANVTQQLKYS